MHLFRSIRPLLPAFPSFFSPLTSVKYPISFYPVPFSCSLHSSMVVIFILSIAVVNPSCEQVKCINLFWHGEYFLVNYPLPIKGPISWLRLTTLPLRFISLSRSSMLAFYAGLDIIRWCYLLILTWSLSLRKSWNILLLVLVELTFESSNLYLLTFLSYLAFLKETSCLVKSSL